MHPIQESFRNICNWSDATMMSSNATSPAVNHVPTPLPHVEMSPSSSHDEDAMKVMATPAAGHMMSADDPDNPQNWPTLKKSTHPP